MSHTTPGVNSKTPVNIKDCWRTNLKALLDATRLVGFPFRLDVAADEENSLCDEYFSAEDNALTKSWACDGAVWCNPPFSLKREFLEKAWIESIEHKIPVCVMIPFEPATKWWADYVMGRATVVFIPDGRYSYLHPETGEDIGSPNFASCFVVFTPLDVPTQYVHFERTK